MSEEVKEETGTEEMVLEVNEKNIPIWKDDGGNVIKGIPSALFLKSEDIAPADKQEARIEYLRYQNALKEIYIEGLDEKKAKAQATIEKNNEKIDILENGESEEAKKARERETLLRRHRAMQKKLVKEYGVDPSELEDLDVEDDD